MKARYKMPLTAIEREAVERIMEEVKEKSSREQNRAILRTFKIACLILHQDFGFGGKRLEKFVDLMNEAGRKAAQRPEIWFHVDEQLKALGFEFDPEDLEERVEHTKELYKEQGRKFREY